MFCFSNCKSLYIMNCISITSFCRYYIKLRLELNDIIQTTTFWFVTLSVCVNFPGHSSVFQWDPIKLSHEMKLSHHPSQGSRFSPCVQFLKCWLAHSCWWEQTCHTLICIFKKRRYTGKHFHWAALPSHTSMFPASIMTMGYCQYGVHLFSSCAHGFPLGFPVFSHRNHAGDFV